MSDKKQPDNKKTKNSILTILLVGYIIMLAFGLSLMYKYRNDGLEELYDTIDNKCYNSVELRQHSYSNNEKYIIYYGNYDLGKYNCSIITRDEFLKNMEMEVKIDE